MIGNKNFINLFYFWLCQQKFNTHFLLKYCTKSPLLKRKNKIHITKYQKDNYKHYYLIL